MKKILTMLLVVCTVFVFSACGKQTLKTEQLTKQGGDTQKNEEGSFYGNVKDLLSMNKSQKCTWSEDDSSAKGVLYIDGEKMRSEAQNVVIGEENQSGDMFMINDGEWIYTWDNTTKKGMKMKNEEIQLEDAKEDKEEMDYTINVSEENNEDLMSEMYNYKCENWKADASKFVPPADIQFQNMNAMMENMQNMTGNMEGMCDFAQGADKEECLESMKNINTNMKGVTQ